MSKIEFNDIVCLSCAHLEDETGQCHYNCERGKAYPFFEPKDYESDDEMVSHPDHYQAKSGLETIRVIEAFTDGLEGIEAVCTANVIKYICRWKKKNGLQDLKKAQWYLTYLINHVEADYKKEEEDYDYPMETWEEIQNKEKGE